MGTPDRPERTEKGAQDAMKRIPPSVQMQQALMQNLQAGVQGRPLRQFVLRAAGLLLQVGLEEQVEAFLGRGHHEKDLEECVTYLLFPVEHRKGIRTTNLLERTFEESRRPTKVIPRFPGERACLTLVFATLIAAAEQWRASG